MEYLSQSEVAKACNDATEQFLEGALPLEKLRKARYAAYATAYAADSAAYVAAYADAAYAYDAADAAARATADAAARAKEREWQKGELIRLM